ncbi:hypothetical protein [Sinomonas sp. G460-2]|uniref:hypothetical protein n=1 Tax=Sinomonas sp. G460-2 TaxID=3393464 RepID=UPI0039F13255
MSDDPPEPIPPPSRGKSLARRVGGSILLGLLVGALVQVLIFAVSSSLPWQLVLVAVLAYLVLAGVAIAAKRATRFGAGLLFALGLWVVILAGVCTGTLGRYGA